jgi:DNA-binding FadR family transcriptional regulator
MHRPDHSDRRYLAIAQQILTDITVGDLRPGDRLRPERELAAAHSVSRATAREAVLVLELIGAVEVRHGDGTFVRSVISRLGAGGHALDLPPRELIEARLVVEPALARLSASRIDGDQLSALTSALDTATAIADDDTRTNEFVALGLRFHAQLAGLCGNSILAGVVQQLVDVEFHPLWILLNQQSMYSRDARLRQVYEHRAVVDALGAGSPDAAAAALDLHLSELTCMVFGGDRGGRTGPAESTAEPADRVINTIEGKDHVAPRNS